MKNFNNSRALPRALGIAALVAALGVLSGCWEDTDVPATTTPPAGPTVPAFTVEAPAGSPIAGAKVEVPADAVVAADNITIGYEDALPLAVDSDVSTAGYEQLSKTLVITRTGESDFGQTVDVTMPYDKSKLPDDATPIVVYLDEDTGSYSPIAVKSIDRANGKITFLTSHASKYAVVWIKVGGIGPIDPSKLTTSVNFNPVVDSFFVHNFGSYEEPGGNSFGMAGYAAWYHHARKATKGAALSTLYREGNPALEEDDQVARELIMRAYQAGNQKSHIKALDNAATLGATNIAAENTVAMTIIQQLLMTKQAQLMVMGKGSAGSWTDGQTVAVYAYDGAAQRFSFYDTRFPGEVVTVPWNPTTGFGVDSKNKEYDVFAFASFNSAYSSKTLNSLYVAAEAGFPTSLYPKIAVTAPAELSTSPGTFEVATDDSVTVRGTVPRPASANPSAPRYAHVYLNGTRLPTAYPVDAASNAFEFTIAKLPSAAGTDVMVLVSETEKAYAGWGSGAAWAGGFHAFKQFRLRVANQFFFQNMGLETGDFTGWVSERHSWGGSSAAPDVTPSDKSEVIATPGFDPIATDLQVPLFGTKAARINNEDNNEHISTLTQTAVVPSGKNPVLRFYWSAVLEDPQHDPEDQPYIEIVVQNKTKNIDLYRKRFFANDPSYSGWLSYQGGDWKSIPWQLVELAVAEYAGDTIELKIEAADCALGGHGGYGYLDVDE